MTGRKIPTFDFLGKAPIAYLISTCMIVASLYVFFEKGDTKYGVDFTGGHELVVKVGGAANSDSIRMALAKGGYENAVVQSFEVGSQQYSIRLEGAAGEADALKAKMSSILKESFPDQATEILKNDFVGPAVGEELKTKALLAIGIALLGMLAFISYRFELAFAVGAVVALLHDVIVCTGVYLVTGHTLSMGALAAALTITGYSVNDTIVIFDRIREEITKQKKSYSLVALMNHCVNMMLSRTIITHVLTLFSAIALYVFGGGAIADLSLFLLVGVITGSYSTIYIACPVVLAFHKFRGGSLEQEH